MALPLDSEQDTVTVVLIGSFNPAIFQPMWFAGQEMLGRKDAEEAQINAVTPDVTQFQTRQFRVQVEHNRFIAACEAIHRNIVRDLVLSCFGRVLVHCPIGMLGINRELHFNCGSENQRAKYGFELAPLVAWGKWGDEIQKKQDAPLHGGMMLIQMREQPREDKRDGYIQTQIQPSQLIQNESGIFIQVNNHFQFAIDQEHPALKAMETLDTAWEAAMTKAESIISEVMIRATGKANV